MYIKQEIITVDRARKLLEEHDNIRPLNRNAVALHAISMLEETWVQPHPAPLCISAEGLLVDGQHRLHAQVTANMPLIWNVAYDVTPEMLRTIDCGNKRALAIRTEGEYTTQVKGRINAIVAVLYRFAFAHHVVGLTPTLVAPVRDALLTEGSEAVFTGSGRIPAPVRAAFCYAWPISPKVGQAWAQLTTGEVPDVFYQNWAITFSALEGVAYTKQPGGGNVQRETFNRTCRCLLALIKGEKLKTVRVNDLAFKALQCSREPLPFLKPPTIKKLTGAK